MKAVICTAYGAPEVLQVASVKKPVPKRNEILVKIKSTAVNSGDVRVRGLVVEGIMKLIMRLAVGIRKPRKPILGTVFAGVVEEIGEKVTAFEVGDEVFGMTGFQFGTYAEYLSVPETSTVILKPKNASFDEAAALPFGGQTAHHFLMKAGINTRNVPSVLIVGATGSVGVAAIQIAKKFTSDITAVCSTRGEKLARDLGAKDIILYDELDFRSVDRKFDIIFDAVGKTTKKECAHLLNNIGVFVTVGGLDYASETHEQLIFLKEAFEAGEYKAVIDKTFDMEDVVEAHTYVDTGRKKGNVVLRVSD
jgi:NADPH:quinone reductase-like Zn-dependent oxidoreductase